MLLIFMPKLLVPIKVSTGRRGQVIKGTKAFAEIGTQVSPELVQRLRDVRKRINKMDKLEASGQYRKGHFIRPLEEVDWVVEKVANQRRNIAHNADFFIKGATPLRSKIRDLLVARGIPVEVPMMDLKDRTELFARDGFHEIPDYPNNFKEIKSQVINILAGMHKAGVTHNHLHMGNFVMNKEGAVKIKLIDLSMAKLYAKTPKNKETFLRHFTEDIFFVARGLAHLERRYSLPSENEQLTSTIEKNVKEIVGQYKLPYAISLDDLFRELRIIGDARRAKADKRKIKRK